MMVLHARCFARDGKADQALQWLGTAVQLGFRELELLQEAEDFGEVVALPGFQELLDSVE